MLAFSSGLGALLRVGLGGAWRGFPGWGVCPKGWGRAARMSLPFIGRVALPSSPSLSWNIPDIPDDLTAIAFRIWINIPAEI